MYGTSTHEELTAAIASEGIEEMADVLIDSLHKGEWEVVWGKYHLVVFRVCSFGLGLDFAWGGWPCWTISLLLPFVSVAFGRHDWPAA